MKLPDVNLLLYATNEATPHHAKAHAWWEETMSGSERVALSWTVLLAFIRLTTRRAVMNPPLRPDYALDLVDQWLAQPCATVVHPTREHPALLRDLARSAGAGGTTDVHLAALAIEHRATLCSANSSFSRFPGLRWLDPIHD